VPFDASSLDILLGPVGLTFGAVLLLWLFVTERIIPRGRLEDQKAATAAALAGWRDANLTTEKMAEALETRNTLDTEALRTLREQGERDRGRREGRGR